MVGHHPWRIENIFSPKKFHSPPGGVEQITQNPRLAGANCTIEF
jgi:hypothetical protein